MMKKINIALACIMIVLVGAFAYFLYFYDTSSQLNTTRYDDAYEELIGRSTYDTSFEYATIDGSKTTTGNGQYRITVTFHDASADLTNFRVLIVDGTEKTNPSNEKYSKYPTLGIFDDYIYNLIISSETESDITRHAYTFDYATENDITSVLIYVSYKVGDAVTTNKYLQIGLS